TPPQLKVTKPPPESLLEKSVSLVQFVTSPLACTAGTFTENVSAVNAIARSSRRICLTNMGGLLFDMQGGLYPRRWRRRKLRLFDPVPLALRDGASRAHARPRSERPA